MDGIIDKARARGVGAGVHAISPVLAEQQARWAGRGANLILHSADIIAASEKLAADIGDLRHELADVRTPPPSQEINI